MLAGSIQGTRYYGRGSVSALLTDLLALRATSRRRTIIKLLSTAGLFAPLLALLVLPLVLFGSADASQDMLVGAMSVSFGLFALSLVVRLIVGYMLMPEVARVDQAELLLRSMLVANGATVTLSLDLSKASQRRNRGQVERIPGPNQTFRTVTRHIVHWLALEAPLAAGPIVRSSKFESASETVEEKMVSQRRFQRTIESASQSLTLQILYPQTLTAVLQMGAALAQHVPAPQGTRVVHTPGVLEAHAFGSDAALPIEHELALLNAMARAVCGADVTDRAGFEAARREITDPSARAQSTAMRKPVSEMQWLFIAPACFALIGAFGFVRVRNPADTSFVDGVLAQTQSSNAERARRIAAIEAQRSAGAPVDETALGYLRAEAASGEARRREWQGSVDAMHERAARDLNVMIGGFALAALTAAGATFVVRRRKSAR
jgi:hypothetical protein